MQNVISVFIPILWLITIAGWLWLVILGFKYRGIVSGILFILLGYLAMVYGFRKWLNPEAGIQTKVPFFMMSGGLTMIVLLVILSSVIQT